MLRYIQPKCVKVFVKFLFRKEIKWTFIVQNNTRLNITKYWIKIFNRNKLRIFYFNWSLKRMSYSMILQTLTLHNIKVMEKINHFSKFFAYVHNLRRLMIWSNEGIKTVKLIKLCCKCHLYYTLKNLYLKFKLTNI